MTTPNTFINLPKENLDMIIIAIFILIAYFLGVISQRWMNKSRLYKDKEAIWKG